MNQYFSDQDTSKKLELFKNNMSSFEDANGNYGYTFEYFDKGHYERLFNRILNRNNFVLERPETTIISFDNDIKIKRTCQTFEFVDEDSLIDFFKLFDYNFVYQIYPKYQEGKIIYKGFGINFVDKVKYSILSSKIL